MSWPLDAAMHAAWTWTGLGLVMIFIASMVAAATACVLVQMNARQTRAILRDHYENQNVARQLMAQWSAAVNTVKRSRKDTNLFRAIQQQLRSLVQRLQDVDDKVIILSEDGIDNDEEEDDIDVDPGDEGNGSSGGNGGGGTGDTGTINNSVTGTVGDPSLYRVTLTVNSTVVPHGPTAPTSIAKTVFMYSNPNNTTSVKWLYDYIPGMVYLNTSTTDSVSVDRITYTFGSSTLPNAWYPGYVPDSTLTTAGLATYYLTTTQYVILPEEAQKVVSQTVTYQLNATTVQIITDSAIVVPPSSYLWLVRWTAGF